ncbi:alpha-glucosidase [Staphylococcus gallinarum]|uniref:Alpha-glucosidase n=1 Tax=Staphylococcus gallinarum TaxID=1293 RepID=A0A380FB56_STAGA|nr:alpha-glucosidase [Staphylococcus gallinarum]
MLHTYRKLIQLRHEHDIVTYGSIEPLHMEHDKLFIYKRHYNEETWLIIANFSKESCEIPADINLEGEVMITNGTITGNQITGFGSIVIQQ